LKTITSFPLPCILTKPYHNQACAEHWGAFAEVDAQTGNYEKITLANQCILHEKLATKTMTLENCVIYNIYSGCKQKFLK
jgi:hypothetical protein